MKPDYKCNKCLGQWYSRVIKPVKCPRCYNRKIEPIVYDSTPVSIPNDTIKNTQEKTTTPLNNFMMDNQDILYHDDSGKPEPKPTITFTEDEWN
jgi:hypothetical protein